MTATGGVFRLSRNPIHLGVVLIYAGVGFAVAEPWFLIFTVLIIIVSNLILISPEEKYLLGVFGQEYQDYKETVRRWI